MDTNSKLTVTAKGGTVTSAEAEVKPTLILGKGVEQTEVKNDLLPIGPAMVGTAYKGTTLAIKVGATTSVEKIDVADREVCRKVAKSYVKTQVLRAFGYNLYAGQKIPRLSVQHDGTSKRFKVPAVEEGINEQSYMTMHKDVLQRTIEEVTTYVQSGQGAARSILDSSVFE